MEARWQLVVCVRPRCAFAKTKIHATISNLAAEHRVPCHRAHPHLQLPWPSAACPCPTEKLKTHTCSEGELTLFLLLINRRKTKQCWRRSSARPDPAPPPSRQPSGQEGQSLGGKNTARSATGRKGKNTRKEMQHSTAIYQLEGGKKGLFPPVVLVRSHP